MSSAIALAGLALFGLSNADFFGTVSQAETESTQFALTYGYPLSVYTDYVAPILSAVGTNRFLRQTQPATSSGTSNGLYPDADALYSRAVVDLSASNVQLTLPSMPAGEYHVVSFYDLFGDNIANIGSVNVSHAGKYLLQSVLDNPSDITGYQAANDSSGYQGFVNFPGRYGSLLQRYILPGDQSDLEALHALQNATLLQSVGRARSQSSQAPALTYQLLNDSKMASTELVPETTQRLQAIARLTPFNPPETVADQANVERILEMAGIQGGKYTKPDGVNITEAVYGLRAAPQTDSSFFVNNNGWTQQDPAVQGNFHGDYVQRSTVSYSGYLEMTPDQALYPSLSAGSGLIVGADASSLGAGAIPVGAKKSLLLTFVGGKPPVNAYWSVTAYDLKGQLVENSIHRYSIGSRANITYPNGEPVYGSKTGSQSAFQILIQPADNAPPANWTSNWLPSPAGGANTTLYLRFYAPQGALLDNSYKFPVLTNQSAFV